MTTARHQAYRRAIRALSATSLAPATVEQLRDIAEGLLLARTDESVRDLMLDAELSLVMLSESGELNRDDAAAFHARIGACGPTREPAVSVSSRPKLRLAYGVRAKPHEPAQ
jgi:hypothetical protein